MIPTRRKSKLPADLSYPIGAREVNQSLSDAPHLETISLTFRDRPTYRASEFRRWLKDKVPYPVVVAEFHPARKPSFAAPRLWIEEGWFNEKWELAVYPVPRKLRHSAHRLLLEQGVARLLQWLHASKAPGWTSCQRRCELVFDPGEETITAREVKWT